MSIHEAIELPESEGGGKVYGAPPRLYHYTSQKGLLGILEDGTLRCSSAHYLSDAKEIEHAVELAVERIDAVASELVPRDPRIDDDEELIRSLKARVEGLLESPVYVFSMSVYGNLLSQWRAYCPDSGGYSIGFSTRDLKRLAEWQGFELVQCIYGEEHQRLVLDELIRETVGAYQEKREEGAAVYSHLWQRYEVEFLTRFFQHAAAFKDPAFLEEHEFRLVSGPFAKNRGKVEHREGPSTPIPYIEFELRQEETHRLPISRVWVGPTPHRKLAVRAVQELVDRHALPTVDVRYSDIPYRTW